MLFDCFFKINMFCHRNIKILLSVCEFLGYYLWGNILFYVILIYFVASSVHIYSYLEARDPLGGLEDVPALRLGPGPAAGQDHRELARPRPALQTRPHHSGGLLQQTLQHSNSQGSKGKNTFFRKTIKMTATAVSGKVHSGNYQHHLVPPWPQCSGWSPVTMVIWAAITPSCQVLSLYIPIS